MKTSATIALIDITSVTEKNGVYTVDFWDENCENENNATIQISKDSLLDFVANTFMNYINSMDEICSVKEYFAENIELVIKEYIQFNS